MSTMDPIFIIPAEEPKGNMVTRFIKRIIADVKKSNEEHRKWYNSLTDEQKAEYRAQMMTYRGMM